jgi:hypothetical protein
MGSNRWGQKQTVIVDGDRIIPAKEENLQKAAVILVIDEVDCLRRPHIAELIFL